MLINVTSDYSKLFVSEIIDGKTYHKVVKDFKPEIFTDSTDPTEEFSTLIGGHPVRKHVCDNIVDYNNYTREMSKMNNFTLYGKVAPEYQYHRAYKADKIESLRYWYFDIETELGPNNSFPNPLDALAKVTLIQIMESDTKNIYIFGWLQDYTPVDDDVTYFYCKDEYDMLNKFVEFQLIRNPVIVTAWNGEMFDFPTIVNRMKKNSIAPEILSPFNKMEKRNINIYGKYVDIEVPSGITWLDYINCYKKTDPSGQESWALEHMSKVILGDEEGGKLELSKAGFANTKELVLKNYNPDLDKNKGALYEAYLKGDLDNNPDFQREWYLVFVQYGVIDVRVMYKMDEKTNALNAITNLAQLYGCNIHDVFSTVKPWQIFLYDTLYERKQVFTAKSGMQKYSIPGGYVFSIPGIYKWSLSEDAASMYPNNMRRNNMSPETYISREDIKIKDEKLYEITKILHENFSCEDEYMKMSNANKNYIKEKCKEFNITMAVNGAFFTLQDIGIVPDLITIIFDERKKHKKLMKNAERAIEKIENELRQNFDESLKEELQKQKTIQSVENTNQLVRKLIINSLYGAFGNEHFSLYNPYIADATTAMGRYDIKTIGDYVIDKINSVYNEKIIFRNQTDTDSFFLCMDKLVELEIKNKRITNGVKSITKFLDEFDKKVIQNLIQQKVNETQDMLNCSFECVSYDREKICSMVSTGKKRYAVKLYDDEGVDLTSNPKIKITGLEIKRSDTPADVRIKLITVIDLLFKNSNNELVQFIDNYRKEHKTTPLDKIAIPKGVNDIKKYNNTTKGVPMHVRASKVCNEVIKTYKMENDYQFIVNGDKVKFVPLKIPNVVNSDVIAFKDVQMMYDLGLDKKIDYSKLFDRTFMSPVNTLVDAIGWKSDNNSLVMGSLF